MDGKKFKKVAKRLAVARGQPGKLYGGKLLVGYVPTEGLARAFSSDPDGEANDCKLMPDLIDEWGWMGSPRSKNRLYVRRSRLQRPGEEEIIVITDLLDQTQYPAADLLIAYQHRWGIEQVFQQITEVFSLQQLIGSTPQATIFQGAFCLLLYNILQIVRQQIAAAQPVPCAASKLSLEEIFKDATRQLIGLTELIKPADDSHDRLLTKPATGCPVGCCIRASRARPGRAPPSCG